LGFRSQSPVLCEGSGNGSEHTNRTHQPNCTYPWISRPLCFCEGLSYSDKKVRHPVCFTKINLTESPQHPGNWKPCNLSIQSSRRREHAFCLAHRCPPLPTSAHLCSPLPASAHLRPPLPTAAHRCQPLPTTAHLCPPLPTSASLCPPLPTAAHRCPPLSTSVPLCPHPPTSAHFPPTSAHLCPPRPSLCGCADVWLCVCMDVR
jgi:hypothetical protein